MKSQSAVQQFRDLHDAVARGRAAIADGAMIDLAGLDAQVARVVDQTRSARLSDRTELLAAMAALLQALDDLAFDLRRQHDSALARQAACAYGAEAGSR